MINFIRSFRNKYKSLGSVIKDNTGVFVFLLIFIYTIVFFFLMDNLNDPQVGVLSTVIFLVPSIVIFLWFVKLIYERLTKKAGSELKLRLTLYFFLITLIPFVVIMINSNNFVKKIYKEYISLDEIEDISNQVTRLMTKRSEENLIIDISDSISLFYRKSSRGKLIPVEIITKTRQSTDYIIVFEVNVLKETSQMLTYIINENFSGDSRKEFGENQMNDLLKENFFFKGDTIKTYTNNVKNTLQFYKLSHGDYVNFYIQHIPNSILINSGIMEPEELIAKKNSRLFFAIGINHIPQRDIDISNKLSKLSGKLAKRNLKRNEAHSQLNRYIVYISLPISLISILLSFYLAIRFIRPMEQLIRGTKIIASGEASFQIEEGKDGELGQLTEAFNMMANELRKNKVTIYKTQKAAAWREVARKLAHEIKNPLTPIQLAAERIKKQYKKQNPNIEDIINTCTITIIEESKRLSSIIQDFSDFARKPESKRIEENIKEIMATIVKTYSEIRPNIMFNYTDNMEESDATILLDKQQMKQVLINLLENSVEVLPKINGIINIKLDKKYDGYDSYCIIEVKDNGNGMTEETKQKIFTPYFTTKERGTGLGLIVVKDIIEEHKGSIYFESEEEKGTSFFIELPIKANNRGEING